MLPPQNCWRVFQPRHRRVFYFVVWVFLLYHLLSFLLPLFLFQSCFLPSRGSISPSYNTYFFGEQTTVDNVVFRLPRSGRCMLKNTEHSGGGTANPRLSQGEPRGQGGESWKSFSGFSIQYPSSSPHNWNIPLLLFLKLVMQHKSFQYGAHLWIHAPSAVRNGHCFRPSRQPNSQTARQLDNQSGNQPVGQTDSQVDRKSKYLSHAFWEKYVDVGSTMCHHDEH